MCLSSNDENGQLEWIKNEGDVDEAIDAMFVAIIDEMDRFQNYGSGYKWDDSISLEILIMKKSRGTARSKKAGHYIATPKWIKDKCATINMKPPKQHDDKCFAWVLLRARYPIKAKNGGIQYRSISDLVEHLHEVILPPGVTYPIPLRTDVRKSFFFVCSKLTFLI